MSSLPAKTKVIGDRDRDIKNLYLDSRQVQTSDAFVAIKGGQLDGHDYIDQAISNGCVVIFCQKEPILLSTKVTYVITKDLHENLWRLAADFYERPSTKTKIVGITGTNGKTTVATMFYKLMRRMDVRAGLISTVDIRINDEVLPTKLTTPDVISINRLMAEMVSQGCEYIAMEVSSHAIAQNRIKGIEYDVGVFTNITHDHLDYHKTFKDYLNTKKQFFDVLDKKACAITNVDDKNGMVMMQNTKADIKTYGIRSMADYKARVIEHDFNGLHLKINQIDFYSKLMGQFNVYNLLAVIAIAKEFGFEMVDVLIKLSLVSTAPGRFEIIRSGNSKTIGIVDYAHTPDALQNVLQTIADVNKGNQKLTVVIGAGGDRDTTKRPKMARIAVHFADQVILTSDNPRSEDPEKILDDMEEGIPHEEKEKVLRISDRKQAIKAALQMTSNGIVLVVGKGHENYQEIKGKRHHFDDKEIVQEFLR